MGRPLNKKYFGNKNAPYTDFQGITNPNSGTAGEGVASYTSISAGIGWTAAPTIVVDAPSGIDGVTATIQAHYKALILDVYANGTGYQINDVVTLTTGTFSTAAASTVSGVVTVGVPTVSVGGTNYDNGDQVTFSGLGWATPLVVQIATSDTGVAQTVTVVTPGVWSGSSAPSTTAGSTVTLSLGSVDNNGAGLVLTIPAWGVYSLSAPTIAGDYTTFPSRNASGTTSNNGSGTGCKVNSTLGLLSIEILTPGAGYLSSSDAGLVITGGTPSGAQGADAVAVLLSARSNGIISTAWISAAGASANPADIIKQVNDRRYKVETSDGVGVCELVTDGAPNAAGEMTIKATDSAGGTYYVAKLTSRKVILVPDTGTQFASGKSAKWSLTTAIQDEQVVIDNG